MKGDRLSPLQREILVAFARREPQFFLTGGAALAGFHLGHRTTQDLDLFATADRLEDGARALRQVAAELGANLEVLLRTYLADLRARLTRVSRP